MSSDIVWLKTNSTCYCHRKSPHAVLRCLLTRAFKGNSSPQVVAEQSCYSQIIDKTLHFFKQSLLPITVFFFIKVTGNTALCTRLPVDNKPRPTKCRCRGATCIFAAAVGADCSVHHMYVFCVSHYKQDR